MKTFSKVCWYFIRSGKFISLLSWLSRSLKSFLLSPFDNRPMRAIKYLRFVPFAIGSAIVVLTLAYVPTISILSTVLLGSLLTIGFWLAILTAAALHLNASLLIPFFREWCRIGVRVGIFCSIALIGLFILRDKYNQQQAFLIVLSLVSILIYGLAEYLFRSVLWQKIHRLSPVKWGIDQSILTDEEYWRVCIHEAGHLILYGLLSKLPEDAIAIVDRSPIYGFGGFVTALKETDADGANTALLEWEIMTFYAGAAAEKIVFGVHGEGAQEDYVHADKCVRRLGAISPDLNYFPVPSNPSEESANTETILALRKELIVRSEHYLRTNLAALHQIAEFLKEHECMDCEQFVPIWQRLLVPDQWALLDTPGRVPCLSVSR